MHVAMNIEEVEANLKTKRINVHTHIKGLGLNENGEALPVSQGLVGQREAREVRPVVTTRSLT